MNKEQKEAIEKIEKLIKYLKDWKKNFTIVPEDTKYFEKILEIIKQYTRMINEGIEERIECEKEIQKQEKIIDKMAEFLEDDLTIDEFCNKENCYADEYINGHCQKCLNCIKEYFKKEVEKDVKD